MLYRWKNVTEFQDQNFRLDAATAGILLFLSDSIQKNPPKKENIMVVPKNFGKFWGVKMVDKTKSSNLDKSPCFNAWAVPWNVDMNRTALDIIFRKAFCLIKRNMMYPLCVVYVSD
jgi:hypothetical protein